MTPLCKIEVTLAGYQGWTVRLMSADEEEIWLASKPPIALWPDRSAWLYGHGASGKCGGWAWRDSAT
jgi:hypothetical protein